MSKLILVVEDQDDNMQILRDLLVSAGYENVKRFRRDVVAGQYAEVYASVAARGRRSPIGHAAPTSAAGHA